MRANENSPVELELKSLMTTDLPEEIITFTDKADNEEGMNDELSRPRYPTSNTRVEVPAAHTTASLTVISPVLSEALKSCVPPPGQESEVSSIPESANNRRLHSVSERSVHGEQQKQSKKKNTRKNHEHTYIADVLFETRITRNRITKMFSLPAATFPAASDTMNFKAGRPAPEDTDDVELSTAIAFPGEITVATPDRLMLIEVGRSQFELGPDTLRRTGCDTTTEARTLHQRTTPLLSVCTVVSPSS
jgi:hypothetical protein